MLRGERLWDYVTPGGESRRVCVLCKAKAESAGWLPAEVAATRAEQAPRPSRARALRERLARVAESARARSAEPDPEPVAEAEAPPRRRRRLLVERPDPPEERRADPAPRERARPREPRRRPIAGPRQDDPTRRARRAVDRFNASEASRTVAGLTRSLGEPRASIQLGGRGKPATVTVAWELSWYRWEINPGEHGAVREIGKGKEIGELSEADRRWNARIADDGSLRLQAG